MLAVFIFLMFPLTTAAQSPLEKHAALAKRLVNQCANIHVKDSVLISGSVRDADLMNEIAIQVRKIGAFPLVQLNSEERNRRYYDVVPSEYDAQRDELNIQLMNIITASISIDIGETLDLYQNVPPARLAAVSESNNIINDIIDKRNIRSVYLGNGIYPTDALAKQFGMTTDELSIQFWNGINTDYNELQKIGNMIKSILADGKRIQITSQNGTNLSFEITGRPVMVSDGVISDEEMKKGAPACFVWLPAGEVYITPIHGTAEGQIVSDSYFFQGKEIQKLTLTFKAGKLTSMSAKSGLEPFKARYDAAGQGKDEFSFIDIGINPNVNIAANSKMVAWMATGMVTVGHGGNSWAGGDNNSSYSGTYHLPKTTLKVDGKVIVDEGVLKY